MRKLAISCVFIALLAPARGLSALNWTGDLLTNPGAETGAMAPWTAEVPVIVLQAQKENSGWVYPHSGDWFFTMGGASVSPSGTFAARTLHQDVDVSSYAADIDADLLRVQAGIWLQTEDTARYPGADYAQLILHFLDSSEALIDTLATPLLQSPNLAWVEATLDGTAPIGTRAIRFELRGEKHETSVINAFFDDASLQVAVVPEPSTISLFALAALACLRKRR